MTDRLVLGTAGHIDHGKTSLVKALTGVDCDRLPEEKARGITIELGFAPLELASGLRLSVVDVPGHEKLVRTMVSGASGIDLVLFVVAADEGIMPQSREHLAICRLLGVARGVVALTKLDAVEPELAEIARLEVEEELAGTSLAGAPVIGVSAHSGQGLPELVAALDELARTAPPRTLRDGPAWLPVDRVFTMRGFGTVVTGTLRGAPLEEGQGVELWPEGASAPLSARVRGLQVHGAAAKRALPGSRCAVNLQGIDVAQAPRGSVVAAAGRLAFRPRLCVELQLLPGAKSLRSGTTLTFHVGTCERPARVLLLDRARLEPGDTALCELRFATPVVAVEGDRFILRGHRRLEDGGWTVGGGRIVDVAPPRGRRSRAERHAELVALAGDDRAAALAARVRRAGVLGIGEADLARELRSLEGLAGVRVGERWIHPEPFAALVRAVVDAVDAHHRERPEDAWVGPAALASRLPRPLPDEVLRAALEAAARERALESGPSGARRPAHRARSADPALASALGARLAAEALAPTALDALARELGCELRALQTAAEHLAREGRLVRVATGLYFDRPPLDALRERLVAYLRAHREIDPAAYKTLTGQTRKHTVPLMEYFDTEKLTLRRGNVRVLRGSQGGE
jgi:selenocysteine-specific elongation factor